MQPTKMGFIEAVKACFSKAFTFTGRARRSEFWYWVLFTSLVSFSFSILFELVPEDSWTLIPCLMVYGVWYIFNIIASFAVSTRRLHDIGRSGWWYGGPMIYGFVCAMVMIMWCIAKLWLIAYDGTASTAWDTFAPLIPVLAVMFIAFIPYMIFLIVLFVWFCTDGTPGPNKYGENPKGVEVVSVCAPSIETEESNQEETV